MAGPIQQIPRGLLGFFQIKGSRNNPGDLADTLSADIELRDWYFQTNAQLIRAAVISIPAATTNNTTSFPELTVPATEIWFVAEYSARVTTGAGGTVQAFRGATFRLGNLGPIIVSVSDAVAPPAGFRDYVSLERVGFLNGGDALGFFIQNVTVAAAVCDADAWVVRMRA